jgi:hydroxyacylglutathione hydrolase
MLATNEEKMTYSWFNVRQIDPYTWAVDDHGNNIMYLLTGTQKALLIDTSWGIGDLPALVSSLTSLPLTVVNTHGHPDHVGGDGQFPQVFISDADRSLAIGCMSAQERLWAVENNTLPQPFPPKFDVNSWLNAKTTFRTIAERDVVDLGGRKLEVVALPGHSPGSICLLDKTFRRIYTGDSLLPWAIWMHLDESLPLNEFLGNLQRLHSFTDEFDTIWPAHGSLENLPLPKSLLDDMINGIKAVLAGKLKGTPEHTFVGDGVRYDFGTCGVICRSSLIGDKEKNAI